MSDLISRSALLAAYDAAHKGPPGGARKLIEEAPVVDAEHVVHCKDCKHCCNIKDVDPMEPWDGSCGDGFYCLENELDYYSTRYNAKTYFCGDGKKREAQ